MGLTSNGPVHCLRCCGSRALWLRLLLLLLLLRLHIAGLKEILLLLGGIQQLMKLLLATVKAVRHPRYCFSCLCCCALLLRLLLLHPQC